VPTRIAAAAVVVLAALALASPGLPARAPAPVVVVKHPRFGRILFKLRHQALYSWAVEQEAGRIRCTGACAKAWPPLLVSSKAAVPARVPGARGRLGVVRRPDGRLQVTYRGLALYTYADDPPNQVLCNGVNRWFVVHA
jgi:predicted lipoprotein with Yx(FWY)xxD motif